MEQSGCSALKKTASPGLVTEVKKWKTSRCTGNSTGRPFNIQNQTTVPKPGGSSLLCGRSLGGMGGRYGAGRVPFNRRIGSTASKHQIFACIIILFILFMLSIHNWPSLDRPTQPVGCACGVWLPSGVLAGGCLFLFYFLGVVSLQRLLGWAFPGGSTGCARDEIWKCFMCHFHSTSYWCLVVWGLGWG